MSFPFRFEYSKFFSVYQDLDQGEHGNERFSALEEMQVDFQALS